MTAGDQVVRFGKAGGGPFALARGSSAPHAHAPCRAPGLSLGCSYYYSKEESW